MVKIIDVFFMWYRNIIQFMYSFLYFQKNRLNEKKEKVFTFLDNIQQYIDKEKTRFLLTYQDNNNNNNNNMNIDKIFYNIEEYEKMVLSDNNDLENNWKKKILIESTPIGNIIMFYNVYKKGFSYYSDIHITYPLLNAVAMKYVRIFLCRDLFMDDIITPYPSPFILLEENYEKKKENKNKEDLKEGEKEKTNIFKKGPFIKNKNVINKVTGGDNTSEKKVELHLYNVNKFIYMGKFSNFSFMQKIEKRIIHPIVYKNSFQGLFDDEHNLQNEVFSYRDYKKLVK